MPEPTLFVELEGGLMCQGESRGGNSIDALRLQDRCLPALARFVDAGYAIVVLDGPQPADEANTAKFLAERAEFICALLTSQGVAVSALLQCRHPAGSGCDCALPGIGLVAGYISGDRLDRSRSLVVGSAVSAKGLARAMGLSGFLIDRPGAWSDVARTVLDQPRRATVSRTTRETDIEVQVDLDHVQEPDVHTGIGFFDHMLEQLGKHGGFALRIRCSGDLDVDEHHTVEDVALALGQALRQALGDKRGIGRFGFLLPMDETEAKVAIDLSGRAFTVFEGDFPRDSVGGLPTELVSHFFRSLADTLGATLHIAVQGDNAHHMVEACFKCTARALRQALAREGHELPSTKGTL